MTSTRLVSRIAAIFSAPGALLRRLRRDQRGNILMMMGFAMIPLTFAVGFGLDYSRAEKAQTRLNAAADAAALAAVDQSMITQSDSNAVAAATAVFNAQVTAMTGVTVTNLTVTAPTTYSQSLGYGRTATVTYQATSKNMFSAILHVASLPITGTSVATASTPPSINFYMALDTSPSMLLPTTSTGIANLKQGALWAGESAYYGQTDGCDFACHANNMQQWNQGVFIRDANNKSIYLNNGSGTAFYRVDCSNNVYDASNTLLGNNASNGSNPNSCSGTGTVTNPVTLKYLPTGKSNTQANYVSVSVNYPDSWWLAQNYATVNPGQTQINLRTDDEASAAAGVISYAYTEEQAFAAATQPPVYKMQFYTWNVGSGSPAALSTSPFGTMTDVATSQSSTFPNLGAQAPLMYANSYWTSSSQQTNNADTDFSAMLTAMKNAMPSTSGTGSPSSPQNVLMIITDGAADSAADGMGALTANDITKCTAIKATGARIAILYTQYLPSTINYTANPTFNNFANNSIPSIQSQLQSCASVNTDGSYLMLTVTTNQSITTALTTLFQMAIKTAHLVK